MPRRRRPRNGAAGSGSGSGPGGSADPSPAGPGGPVTIPSKAVPMEPPSKGSSSTWEMLPKMAATVSSVAAPTVQPEQGAAWIEENPNKKGAATASSGGVPTVHPGKGSVSSGDKKAATVGGAPMVHLAGSGSGSTGDMLHKKAALGLSWDMMQMKPDVGSSGGKGATGSGSSGTMIPLPMNRVVDMSYAAVVARSGSTENKLQKKADVSSTQGAPMTCPDKGATGSGSTGTMLQKKAPQIRVPGMSYAAVVASSGSTVHMLQKKAAVGSSGEAQMIHPAGMVVISPVSSGRMLQKTVAAVSSGGRPTTLPGKRAVDTGLNEEIPKKKATALSGEYPALDALDWNTTAQDSEESAAKHSTKKGNTLTRAKIAQKNCTEDKAADMGLGGGMLQKSSKMEVHTGFSEEMLHEHPAKEFDAAKDIQDPGKGKVGMGLCEEMPPKNSTALSGQYPALGALDRKTTAPDCEESAAKLSTKKGNTLTSAKIGQKNCTEDKADMGLSIGMLQKQSSEMEVGTSLSREMLHDYPAEETDTAKDIQGSDSNEIVHIKDEITQELESFIQELNVLGKGEDISNEEFLDYLKRMPSGPRLIDLKVSLEDEELDKQENRHALYRLRYYKYKFEQQASKEELHGDKLKEDNHIILLRKSDEFLQDDLHYDKLKEDRHLSLLHKSEKDCDDDFLEEEGFFRRFEEDKTFDWFFHPDYLGCSSLNDYQCLVLKNYAGTEYTRWSKYHKYLHSYEIELEYVKYCEELTKQLKWMEDYVDTDWPCYKWNEISSRGVYQAVKIAATSFHKITPALAYIGFFECKGSMVYDYTFFKELDGLYFEIWRRITYGTKSFKEAVEEVYNLNRFLSRQHYMKAALEFDDTMKMLEKEFHTCTAAITPEVEDRAQELILEAVKKQVNKPKYYEQYIRKKMDIARIIGILDSEESR